MRKKNGIKNQILLRDELGHFLKVLDWVGISLHLRVIFWNLSFLYSRMEMILCFRICWWSASFLTLYVFELGLSNKIEDQTHLAKPTKLELSTVQLDYLVVGNGFLPSQTDSGKSSSGSSFPKPDLPESTMIYNLQCLVFI